MVPVSGSGDQSAHFFFFFYMQHNLTCTALALISFSELQTQILPPPDGCELSPFEGSPDGGGKGRQGERPGIHIQNFFLPTFNLGARDVDVHPLKTKLIRATARLGSKLSAVHADEWMRAVEQGDAGLHMWRTLPAPPSPAHSLPHTCLSARLAESRMGRNGRESSGQRGTGYGAWRIWRIVGTYTGCERFPAHLHL